MAYNYYPNDPVSTPYSAYMVPMGGQGGQHQGQVVQQTFPQYPQQQSVVQLTQTQQNLYQSQDYHGRSQLYTQQHHQINSQKYLQALSYPQQNGQALTQEQLQHQYQFQAQPALEQLPHQPQYLEQQALHSNQSTQPPPLASIAGSKVRKAKSKPPAVKASPADPSQQVAKSVSKAKMPAVLEDHGIRDVWASNMEEELENISKVVKTHKFIAMDTEFPGVVARPIGEFRSTQEYTYHQMKCNVNLLKIIQIGFTFFDDDGNRAKPISTWQFNFKFNLNDDMYAQESIELLRKSGIQFERHERDGMNPFNFAADLIGAGVVLQPGNTFLSFHSGYDFGYFIKMLQNRDLEEDDEEFFSKLKLHCPDIYDVKYLMKSCKDLKGGLQEVSDYLQIKRVGPQHQAGSDSLLTGMAFFKMRELYFENNIEKEKYSGHLYGLGPFASSAANVTNGASYSDYETTDNGAQGATA